jgi:hypothetical protein
MCYQSNYEETWDLTNDGANFSSISAKLIERVRRSSATPATATAPGLLYK